MVICFWKSREQLTSTSPRSVKQRVCIECGLQPVSCLTMEPLTGSVDCLSVLLLEPFCSVIGLTSSGYGRETTILSGRWGLKKTVLLCHRLRLQRDVLEQTKLCSAHHTLYYNVNIITCLHVPVLNHLWVKVSHLILPQRY